MRPAHSLERCQLSLNSRGLDPRATWSRRPTISCFRSSTVTSEKFHQANLTKETPLCGAFEMMVPDSSWRYNKRGLSCVRGYENSVPLPTIRPAPDELRCFRLADFVRLEIRLTFFDPQSHTSLTTDRIRQQGAGKISRACFSYKDCAIHPSRSVRQGGTRISLRDYNSLHVHCF